MKPKTARHICCVRLLNWPIDRLQRQRERARRRDSEGTSPLVLVRTVATRQLIVAANESARKFGIRSTMTLGEARALCANVEYEEHDPARDWKALEALARWMIRFSPVVALPKWEGEAPAEPGLWKISARREPCPPGNPDYGVFLDLTGCERAFHGVENITVRMSMCPHADCASPGASPSRELPPPPGR